MSRRALFLLLLPALAFAESTPTVTTVSTTGRFGRWFAVAQ
jgi:hypothetical protein